MAMQLDIDRSGASDASECVGDVLDEMRALQPGRTAASWRQVDASVSGRTG